MLQIRVGIWHIFFICCGNSLEVPLEDAPDKNGYQAIIIIIIIIFFFFFSYVVATYLKHLREMFQ